jgi:hypothetical protein
MKRLFIIAFMLFVFCLISAEEILKFEELEHDFGDVEEVNGVVTHTFYFTNVSSQPISITGVKAG